jgi:hypothetical protein
MQIQPDYSHQLEEIAKALNRPSIPQWVVALIAALVGFLLGKADQWLRNRRDIRNMRRVLYLDLLTMFERADAIISDEYVPGGELSIWQEEELKRFMKFDGEAYLKVHQDVYMQLPERLDAEWLYASYHRILDDKESSPHENHHLAQVLLAGFVERNELQTKYIKKFLGRAKAEKLIKRLHAIYEQSSKRLSGTTKPMDGK